MTVRASRSGAGPGDGPSAGWTSHVTVDQHGRRTEHTVTISPASLARWSAGSEQTDVEDLVRRSFDFLLERESPSAILGQFELSVIETYFPEYDEVIRSSRG